MKKFLVSGILLLFCFTGITYGKGLQGCCSHHKGVAYCSYGHVVCNDGWQGSSCTCGSSSYSYTTTPTYTYTTTPTYTYTTTPTYTNTTTSTYTNTTTPTYTNSTTPTYTNSTYVNQYAYYDKQCQTQFGANAVSSGTKYCACKQGYTRSSDGKSCISEEKSCQEQFGKYATNSDKKGYCKCKVGYIRNDFDNKTKCISKQEYCKRFGKFAEATDDSSVSPCQCKSGYEFNIDYAFDNSLDYCLPKDEYCKNLYGNGSEMNSSGICVCSIGYKRSSTGACIRDENKEGDINNRGKPDISEIKQYLGDKAIMVESLAEGYKDKDKETQKKIKELTETFKSSEDEYTRNVGIYLGLLIE